MYLDRSSDAIPQATPPAYLARRAERIAFDMLARYSWHGQRGTTLIKDLTRFGARIEGITGLTQQDWLTLLLPEVRPVDAEIAWVAGTSAGLSFGDAIPAEAFANLVRDFATGRG